MPGETPSAPPGQPLQVDEPELSDLFRRLISMKSRGYPICNSYTYLRSFYLDPSRPLGVNNIVFPDVGMPHVLWELEGLKKPVYETVVDAEGHEEQKVVGYETVVPGSMTADEYDRAVRDLVNYLTYMGEPIQQERKRLGVWVLLFLAVMFVVAYLMKKEYWKDVH